MVDQVYQYCAVTFVDYGTRVDFLMLIRYD